MATPMCLLLMKSALKSTKEYSILIENNFPKLTLQCLIGQLLLKQFAFNLFWTIFNGFETLPNF